MEQYQEFMNRISKFELPELSLGEGDFTVNPSVIEKVGMDQAFLPFYGDTTIFDLSAQEKAQISRITEQLYQEVPECFSERLRDETLHMTLHDLSNSPVQEKVGISMQENQAKLQLLLSVQPVLQQTIQMQSKAVFNMVNLALVIGFYPVNETEYVKLMQLYELVDQVQTLPYPLTPHITLAYFRRNGFSHHAAQKLSAAVNALNQQTIEITLDTRYLYYQHFQSMNDYRKVLCFTETDS